MPDITHYKNENIKIYKRPDSERFYCRILMPKSKGYKKRSTKTTDLNKAIIFANQLFQDLTYKVNHNLPINKKTFNEIYIDWFNQKDSEISRAKMIEGTYNRYFKPYLGEKDIEHIGDADLVGYWTWRKNYWRDEKNQKATSPSNQGTPTPSYNTIRIEMGILREIFSYGYSLGFMHKLPKTKPNFLKSLRDKGKHKVRPCFRKEEWVKLDEKMFHWGKESHNKNVIRKKKLLRSFVMFLYHSGLRPGEGRSLTWNNIEEVKDNKDNINKIYIHVPQKNKTGYRKAVGNPNCMDALEIVREISNHTDKNDFIFCDEDGKVPRYLGVSFKNMLVEFNMLLDEKSDVRVLYSLRHSYITDRLLEQVPIHTIARNCGTSFKTIEEHYSHLVPEQHSDILTQGTEISHHQLIEKFNELQSRYAKMDNPPPELLDELTKLSTLVAETKMFLDKSKNK
ncbi:MAG: tyrosine-type recombinase/integrase [Alphaproteobacteria bacterium]